MSNSIIFIQGLKGEVIGSNILWFGRSTASNGVVMLTTYRGKGPRTFARDREFIALMDGKQTMDGVYKNHTIEERGSDYAVVNVVFQKLIKSPHYAYEYLGPTKGYPLKTHPGYKTYWDNNVKSKSSGTIIASELNEMQAVDDGRSPQWLVNAAGFEWSKAGATLAPGWNIPSATSVSTSTVTTGWNTCAAALEGVTSYLYPTISVKEFIYFHEDTAQQYVFGPVTVYNSLLTVSSKAVASMSGQLGFPLKTAFGYPLNVTGILSGDYSIYAEVDSEGTSVDAAYYTARGMDGTTPLWLCTNVTLKAVGNWYEATLTWQYAQYGHSPRLYPTSANRVAGLI